MDDYVTMATVPDTTSRPTGGPGGSPAGSAELLPHVLSWGSVARASHAQCAKAADAIQELENRRNGPGQ